MKEKVAGGEGLQPASEAWRWLWGGAGDSPLASPYVASAHLLIFYHPTV